MTIEFLGEWVLRATATGKPGGAKVEYAPAGSPTSTTPVLTISLGANTPLEISLQDLLGQTGLAIPVPGI